MMQCNRPKETKFADLEVGDWFMVHNHGASVYEKMPNLVRVNDKIFTAIEVQESAINHGHSYEYHLHLVEMAHEVVVIPVDITQIKIDYREK